MAGVFTDSGEFLKCNPHKKTSPSLMAHERILFVLLLYGAWMNIVPSISCLPTPEGKRLIDLVGRFVETGDFIRQKIVNLIFQAGDLLAVVRLVLMVLLCPQNTTVVTRRKSWLTVDKSMLIRSP